MLMKNPTQDTVTIRDLKLTIPPGGTAEIPDGYCLPRKGANTDPVKPIIAMLAPQLVPAKDEAVAAYKANKLTGGLAPEAPPARTAADLTEAGMAPAVAELVAAGNAAPVPKTTPTTPKAAK
jgi:hypothetical protein